MKFSELWLREWVNPKVDTETLCHQLTMAGLEVGSVEPAAPAFHSVVVAEVKAVEPHPDADKLRVCKVSDGTEELQIVCGASNVREGLKIPLIKIGGELVSADGKSFKIKKSKLRGVESFGMLCSAVELGMADSSEGLLELTDDAQVGQDIREHFKLNDTIIEVELTPNRGDCLGLRGIAREVAVLNSIEFEDKCLADVVSTPIKNEEIISVELNASKECPAFSGRVVKGINVKAKTPVWMQERLRRSGLRPINPVVDISNYVMLESGQPSHTFDLSVIDQSLQVRFAEQGEKLTLLDGKEVVLDSDILVVADKSKALSMGGIMGGEHSGINDDTKDVFIECAHFTPLAIAGKARRFGLHTDASHRFERGVDPNLMVTVVERITQLLLNIVGGEAGPIEYVGEKFDKLKTVELEHTQLEALLGVAITEDFTLNTLNRLGIITKVKDGRYTATVPSHRFDITIPEDLIEEIGRIHGMSNIESKPLQAATRLKLKAERHLSPKVFKQALVERGYSEVITYSFISNEQHVLFGGSEKALKLKNPISSELSIMRESLIPSLVETLIFNQKRQQERVLLFEVGSRYTLQDNEIKEEKTLSFLRSGARNSEQWAEKSQSIDFFDFKADVEAVLAKAFDLQSFSLSQGRHANLHPGQSVDISRSAVKADDCLGNNAYFGQLHPALKKACGLDRSVYIAEIPLKMLSVRRLPAFEAVSAFPASRRDLSLLLPLEVSSQSLIDSCWESGPAFLYKVNVFDVYLGKGVETGQKSVALGLIFQGKSITLKDEEIEAAVQKVVAHLSQTLKAVLRDS